MGALEGQERGGRIGAGQQGEGFRWAGAGRQGEGFRWAGAGRQGEGFGWAGVGRRVRAVDGQELDSRVEVSAFFQSYCIYLH